MVILVHGVSEGEALCDWIYQSRDESKSLDAKSKIQSDRFHQPPTADLAGLGLLSGDFLRPQGATPRLLPPYGRVGLLPGVPIKENADAAEGIFGNCRTRVDCGPASGPTLKKALCQTRSFGEACDRYPDRFYIQE